jgi:hypothetical protein
MDRAHDSVDHGRTAVYGSMVDHGQRRSRSSSEEGHAGVPMRGTSLWRLGEHEEETRILTEVFDRWCDDGGTPTSGLDGGGAVMEGRRHQG